MEKQTKDSKTKKSQKEVYKSVFLQITKMKGKTYKVGDEYITEHKESFDSLIKSKIIK